MVLVIGMLARRARRRRHARVVAVHVSAQRMGHDAGVERLAREAIGEMAAVTDVDLEAPIERGLDNAVHLALAIDEAAGVARERMSENVAGLQQRDHPLDDRVGVLAIGARLRQAPELAEMHVDGQLGLLADLRRHLDDANAPAREAADLGMRLDPAHDVLVRLRRRHGRGDVHALRAVELRIIMAFQPAHDIGGNEGQRARPGGLGDEMTEARQRHAGRAALIDHRGHAGMHADHVGVEAEAARHILVDLPMGVDHAGNDELAGDVDDLRARAGDDMVGDSGDLAAANADILDPVDARVRADHPAAAQDDIEFRGFAHPPIPYDL